MEIPGVWKNIKHGSKEAWKIEENVFFSYKKNNVSTKKKKAIFQGKLRC